MTEILTAETPQGREALATVAEQAETPELASVPDEWRRVLIEGGRPAAMIAIDPDCHIAFPAGEVRYARLVHAGTTIARRSMATDLLGALLDNAGADLRQAGLPWIIGRLPYELGDPLGFRAFTHYSAIFARPEEIEQTIGGGRPRGYENRITVEESPGFRKDYLIVTDVQAETELQAIQVLREAAWVARSNGKARIYFEHPTAGLPGSVYPIHETRDSALTDIATACDGRVRMNDSESEALNKDRVTLLTDMVRMTDLPTLLAQVLEVNGVDVATCPEGSIAFSVDEGTATLTVSDGRLEVADVERSGAERIDFSAADIAQIVIGFRSATTQAYLDELVEPRETMRLLDHLFPRFWRFSRCDRWMKDEWA
jgi:hypothetical protein